MSAYIRIDNMKRYLSNSWCGAHCEVWIIECCLRLLVKAVSRGLCGNRSSIYKENKDELVL